VLTAEGRDRSHSMRAQGGDGEYGVERAISMLKHRKGVLVLQPAMGIRTSSPSGQGHARGIAMMHADVVGGGLARVTQH